MLFECGADEASTFLATLLAPGDTVTLVLPEGQNDHDKYDRLLRYVITADGYVEPVGCEGTSGPGTLMTAPTDDGDEWWKQHSSCKKLKQNTNGHPTGPFDRDDPEEAAIYNWFAYGTGHCGDEDGDGLACK